MVGFMNGKAKEENFYKRNIGNAVNLFTDKGATLSGDIDSYSQEDCVVVLKNSIQKVYSNKKPPRYIEDKNDFELDTRTVIGRHITTREDRLGRINEYNREME